MSVPFESFAQTTSDLLPSSTPSQASESGATLCASPDGPTTCPSGPAPAPASRSAERASVVDSPTSATSGLTGSASSASAALQSSLESRLRVLTATAGSTLYKLTWKELVTPSGRRYCLLRASARRTSGTESTGCPTPTSQDSASSGARDYSTESGRHSGTTLTDAARLAGWATPQASDAHGSGVNQHTHSLDKQSRALARLAASGPEPTGSPVATATRGQLNPRMSRWLMGLPDSWDTCAPESPKRKR